MKLKRAKSKAKEILKEIEQREFLEGHIGLIMERASETAHLSPLEQLFYKSIRKDIEELCEAHNRLWDSSKDALNPEKAIINACAALEREVNELNDAMNSFLKASFDNVTKQTVKSRGLKKSTAKKLIENDLTFLVYEKSKKSA